MKVKDIFEDIVDFAKARQQRASQQQLSQKQNDEETQFTKVLQDDENETLTVKELAEFEEWMATAKKKGRIPGYETIDDVLYYLTADVEMPNHITRHKAIEWFSDLSEEEREKVRMIAHHADRMIQVFTILRNKIHGLQNTWSVRFGGKIPSGWDAIDGAAWLDQEFTYDIKQLEKVKKAVSILGQ